MFIGSILIGLVLVISSLFMIKREINKATYSRNKLIEETELYDQKDLMKILEDLQLSLNQMNESFYDIANDLEGKYSVHEKEIADLQKRIDHLIANQQLSKRKSQNMVKTEVVKHQTEMHKQSKQVEGHDQEEAGVIYEGHTHSPEAHLEKTQASVLSEKAQKHPHQAHKPSDVSDHEGDIRTQVISLRSQGYTLPEIAKKLEMGIGELQLMLNIKK